MDIILVGIGGGIGALLRYVFGKLIKDNTDFYIPVNTMIINIIGSFLLGVSVVKMNDHHLATLVQTGVLGGFTTFSTFMVEGFGLLREDGLKYMLKYLIPTVVLGIIFFLIGARMFL